jgi:DNA-binding LacI/PurR family transcriptional regulator
MNRNVTRKDVAQRAGVSVAAITRALNNSGYVEKEKKLRIIQIAEEMGYSPNPFAVMLQKKHCRQIILFQNEMTSPYNIQMFHGIAQKTAEMGYTVLLDMNCDFRSIKTRLVDGLIFPTEGMTNQYINETGGTYYLPFVCISNIPSHHFKQAAPTVIIDNMQVMNIAIDYLLDNGHKKIALAIPANNGHAKIRRDYWQGRMTQEGEAKPTKYLIQVAGANGSDKPEDALYSKPLNQFRSNINDFDYYALFDTGKQAARQFVSSKNSASAVICFNDDMAYGMIDELRALGVRVPEDVSVMGIDGTFIRGWFNYAVTSVATYPEKVGAKCVEVLLSKIEGKPFKHINWTRPRLVEGGTVKKL